MFDEIIKFIKSLYPNQNPVPLHAPVFLGKEKEYLLDCIDSTYVSYVGKYVNRFEKMTAEYTDAKYDIAVVNGTVALQIALQLAGVKYGEEVITQPLTFVATPNAISHCGAKPVFIEVANKYNIPVIEDAAESLGSFYKGKHTGNFGLAGILSYNGNKTITTGGGGMIITDDEQIAVKEKHKK